MGNQAPVGVIYGDISSTRFELAVADPTVKRLDYVETRHQDHRVLGIVRAITRQSNLSFDEAMAGTSPGAGGGRLSATIDVIGFRDERGRIQSPRTPFAPGQQVRAADAGLVASILGLEHTGQGALLGQVKGQKVPVRLDLNTLAQKHVSVLAKTGAGKSYTVGVILEEFLLAKVPLVILDPHGEYGSLRHPNVADKELDAMVRYGIKPKSFQSQIKEYAIDTALNPDAERLRLEGINLEAREIVDILPAKLSGGQVGVLYQAVKEVADHLPAYTLQDVIDAVARNKSSAKWNVLNALEALQATGIFHVRGTPVKELVQPGQCTIINLKGVAPDVQEVVAARLAAELWQARKREDVPPHILVVEEAHNFCPERGVGNAVSGPVLRTVASEGRKFGMGLVIVSQRPAKVDKNVLSQCNTQLVLKVTNPNDLKAIVASVEGLTSDAADEIQRLPVGVAMVAGGGLTQPVLTDVRPRRTRHGGASVDIVNHGKKPVASEGGAEGPRAPAFVSAPEEEPPKTVEPEPYRMPEPIPVEDEVPAEVPAEIPAEIPALVIEVETPAEIASEDARPTPAETVTTKAPEPPRGDHIRAAIQRAQQATPAPPPEPPAIERFKAKDRPAVHRVARRLGIVGGSDPEQTERLLRNLALSKNKMPEHFLRFYRDIARSACFDEDPACIRCPLSDDCQYHQSARRERQKDRGVIRRLWRR